MSKKDIPVSLYGVGLVTPVGSNLQTFVQSVRKGNTGLKPAPFFHGSFLIGTPQFDFEDYRDWIVSRTQEKRFVQLNKSAAENIRFAVGSTIDALDSCPGLEDLIRSRSDRVVTLIGTGLSELATPVIALDERRKAEFAWNRFWGQEEGKQAVTAGELPEGLASPLDAKDEWQALERWGRIYAYFAEKNPALHDYLEELERIEETPLRQVETSLINQLKAKASDRMQLRKRFGCPTPPWEAVSPNILWNIPNLPSAQVSMLLETHGLTAGLSGACSSFTLSLRAGLDEIQMGRADVAIVGAVDPSPCPETVAAFMAARVAAFGRQPGHPLTELRGTHLAGGGCVWVLVRDDVAQGAGLRSTGVRVAGLAVTSDGEHVITPSAEGPGYCVGLALQDAQLEAAEIDCWDLHCTGTPGDTQELDHVKPFLREGSNVLVTARKGIFGHGMGACGGWELTAQLFSPYRTAAGLCFPGCGIPENALSGAVKERGIPIHTHGNRVLDLEGKASYRVAKLNMGVGGISSCVVCERDVNSVPQQETEI